MSRNNEDLEMKMRNTTVNPKILILDIETSPIEAYTWGPKWETSLIEVIKQSQILSYSAKWYNGQQETKGLVDYKGYRPGKINDFRIVKDLHKLLDTADIVVTQNGIDFDTKVINSRILKHNLKPPAPYKNVDTKREAKKYIRMPSYSLDDMGKYFGIGNKLVHTGFDLWKRCMAGDIKAWNLMKKYNARDVRLTERLYTKLRPFMKTHPNTVIYGDKGTCPKCNSDNIHSRGYILTNTTRYKRAQCQDCGGWYKYGKNTYKNKNLGTNI